MESCADILSNSALSEITLYHSQAELLESPTGLPPGHVKLTANASLLGDDKTEYAGSFAIRLVTEFVGMFGEEDAEDPDKQLKEVFRASCDLTAQFSLMGDQKFSRAQLEDCVSFFVPQIFLVAREYLLDMVGRMGISITAPWSLPASSEQKTAE